MSILTRLNAKGERKFEIEIDKENVVYVKLSDINTETTNQPLIFYGAYTKQGKFGETASLICNERLVVNLPKHLTDDVLDMIADDECSTEIKNGNCAFYTTTYIDCKGQTSYSVKWLLTEVNGQWKHKALDEKAIEAIIDRNQK